MLTLGQAARMSRTSKTTLTRAIRAGRLSATRRDDGSYSIDEAELARVYTINAETPATGTATGSTAHRATGDGDPAATRVEGQTIHVAIENAGLRAEVDGLRQILAQMREQLADVKDDRDGWRKQAEAAQRLLAGTTPLPAASEPRRPWWRRRSA